MARLRGRAESVYIDGHNIDGMAGVTPADGSDLPNGRQRLYRYVWPTAAGNIAVRLLDGSDVTLPGVPTGGWTPVPTFTRILATGTTATGIVAGWNDAT